MFKDFGLFSILYKQIFTDAEQLGHWFVVDKTAEYLENWLDLLSVCWLI